MSAPQTTTLLFDLDGTLVHHFGAIYKAYTHTQKELGLPEATYEQVLRAVGGSVPVTMKRLVGADASEKAIEIFYDHFDKIKYEDLYLLPGMRWLLEELRAKKYRMGVFTNKSGPMARDVCSFLNISHYFMEIIGTKDTEWRKPEPEFSHYILDLMHAEAGETLMIGDSPFDIETGHNVGMTSYVIATGSHTAGELAANTPKANGVFADAYELGEALFDLNAPAERESMDAIPIPE